MAPKDTLKNQHSQRPPTFPSIVIAGAISGILVTTIVHPLDLVKVRMQLYPGKVASKTMAKKILHCEGVRALYNGLSAAYLRQATFTSTRLAVYWGWHERSIRKYGIFPGITDKTSMYVSSGLAGGLAGNPSEVALVRMMADCRKNPCSKTRRHKRYNGVFHALYTIATKEGIWSLWRGGTLTLTRAVCISIFHVGSYTEARSFLAERGLVKQEADAVLHTCSSFISGLLTAIITLPVDTIKTNYQIRSDDMSQKEVFLRLLKRNGAFYYWQGFLPYFSRLFLHTTLSYFALHQVNTVFKIYDL